MPPCGMLTKLTVRWIDALAEGYCVLTWETRGLFGGDLQVLPHGDRLSLFTTVDRGIDLLRSFLAARG